MTADEVKPANDEEADDAGAASMLALRFERTGSLDGLKIERVRRPLPQEDQVLVRVYAAGLNPSDVKNVLGRFPYTTLPRTPGRDFAGVVVGGPAVLVGQRVWGTGRDLGFDRDGSHAEYLILPAAGVARLPAELSFVDAASAGVPYTTALEALDRLEICAGERVLILGSGAVANAAAVLARHRGAEPLIVVRTAQSASVCEHAGFAVTLVPEGKALPSGYTSIFDTTGHRLPDAIQALERFGRVAIIAGPPSGTVEAPVLALYRKGASIIGINSLLHDTVECVQMLDRIAPALQCAPPGGAIQAVAIDDAVEAYRAVDAGSRAKFVLIMPVMKSPLEGERR